MEKCATPALPPTRRCRCSALVLGVTSYDIHRSIANNSIPVTEDQLGGLRESLQGARGRAEREGQGPSHEHPQGQGRSNEVVLDMPKGR